MKNTPTCSRVWISFQRGLTTKQMLDSAVPQDYEKNDSDDSENITKLTLYRNFYKQEALAVVFYDETLDRYVFDQNLDENISEQLANRFAYYMKVYYMKAVAHQFDDNFTIEHMILALGFELQDYINNGYNEPQENL